MALDDGRDVKEIAAAESRLLGWAKLVGKGVVDVGKGVLGGGKEGQCSLTPLNPGFAQLTPRLLSALETKV